ncbi:MAG: endonuclease [Bacteroidaceae bacterium]|nr:endonuclease [Bacteroidaceae bacterium]
MKRFHLLTLLLLIAVAGQAAIPSGYYTAANGQKGAALKTALYGIISQNTTVRTYKQLWEDFKTTDVRSDGYIRDRYSSITSYVPGGSAQGGDIHGEGTSYNREHSFPKSWFGSATPMYTDLFHLIPVDGQINSSRGNVPFGETSSTVGSSGLYSKWGASTVSGYTGTVFEPADEWKGDFARIYFYMVTRYENVCSSWSSDMLAGNKYPALADWALKMLLRWAKNDPVSDVEIARNEAVYGIQGNRNPYVDFEGLEQHVWGDYSDQAVDLTNYTSTYQRTDASGNGGVESVTDDGNNESGNVTGTDLYELVTSTDQLEAGKRYIIVNKGKTVAMAGFNSGNYFETVTANYSSDDINIASGMTGVSVLILGGEAGAWTFQLDQTGTPTYLNCTSGKSLTTTTTVGETAKWTISFATSGTPITATITNTKTTQKVNNNNPNVSIQYNSSSPRFAAYGSSQQAVLLYKQKETVVESLKDPTFSIETDSEVEQGTTVTINTATSGATIYYSTDGGETFTAATSGASTATVTLSTLGTADLAAYAVHGDETSSTVYASYTVVAPRTTTFEKITSASDLASIVGKQVIIVCENNEVAMGAQDDKLRSPVAVTIKKSADPYSVELTDASGVSIMTFGGDSEGYTFQFDDNAYLAMSGSNNTTLTTANSLTNNSKWKISFTSEGNATIQSLTTTTTTRYIRSNNQSKKFGYYASEISVQLYAEATPTPLGAPTFSKEGGTLTVDANVTITPTGTGSSVKYRTKVSADGGTTYGDWSTWATAEATGAYAYTFATPGTVTLEAASTKDGETSEETSSYTFTVKPHKPTASPAGGTYTATQSVTLTAADGAAIYYTTDGSVPHATTSTLYSAPISVAASMRIRAIAVQNGVESDDTDVSFTIAEAVSGSDGEYERIYSTDDLVVGGQYLIVFDGTIGKYTSSVTIGDKNSDNNRKTFDVSSVKDDDVIDLSTLGSLPLILTLKSKTETGKLTFSFVESDKTYYLSGPTDTDTDKNYLKTVTAEDGDKTKWIVSSFENGTAHLQWAQTATEGTARYIGVNLGNTASGTSNPLFSTYKATNSGSGISIDLQIFGKRTKNITVSKYQYGTFYDERAFVMPTGLSGATLTGTAGNQLTAGTTYTAGQTVPGKTALLLHDDVADSKSYTLTFVYKTAEKPSANADENYLHGSQEGVTASTMATASGLTSSEAANNYFYSLQTSGGANMGFYWKNDTGTTFDIAGGKCWLALPKSMDTRALVLDFDQLTAIANAPTATANETAPAVYDLQGRRVVAGAGKLPAGIYIIGGRKVIIK